MRRWLWFCLFVFWTAYSSASGVLDAYLHAWTWLTGDAGLLILSLWIVHREYARTRWAKP